MGTDITDFLFCNLFTFYRSLKLGFVSGKVQFLFPSVSSSDGYTLESPAPTKGSGRRCFKTVCTCSNDHFFLKKFIGGDVVLLILMFTNCLKKSSPCLFRYAVCLIQAACIIYHGSV